MITDFNNIALAMSYREPKDFPDGPQCAILPFVYTYAIVVGIRVEGYERRYCYEHAKDASEALKAWDGKGHPGGPWIKCKGSGIDLLNPNLKDF